MKRKVTSLVVLFFVAAGFPLNLAGSPSASSSTTRKLTSLKARLMSADYRADLAELASLRNQIAPLKDDPDLGYLADYWSGYASWRLAINGANARMSPEDLKAHLERAVADFESSIGKKGDFADAFAAAASVHGWLTSLHRDDPAVMRQHLDRSARLLAKAEELEPRNPRVLWVRGGVFLFAPPAYGGSTERAIETYRLQADSSGPLMPDSPSPDWGKAEALMSLAYAHLNQKEPDLNAATQEARAALDIEPHWSYVRDILRPQIDARRKQLDTPKP
jgi:hypothetical protein